MRTAARVDANQVAIVAVLRKAGASVQHLHQVGAGCPDILVGFRYGNFLMEIKDPGQIPSKQELSDDEKKFHMLWKGQVNVVKTWQDALRIIGLKDVVVI